MKVEQNNSENNMMDKQLNTKEGTCVQFKIDWIDEFENDLWADDFVEEWKKKTEYTCTEVTYK